MLKNDHQRYHAHLYFDEKSQTLAEDVCIRAWKKFNIQLGRMHQKCVGPHPRWSCQLSFSREEFQELTTFLGRECEQLSVLIHPTTGNNLLDHSELAQWIGEPLRLDLSSFK